LVVTVALLFAPTLHSQTSPTFVAPVSPGSDALPFLTEVFSRYAQAKTYHIEYTEEEKFTGEHIQSSTESMNFAAVGPGNQYRFEYRGELQVSDGKTQWDYRSGSEQYTQQPTPSGDPTHVVTLTSSASQSLSEAPGTVRATAHLGDLIRTAKFVPDQVIQIRGKSVPCTVVTTEGMLPGLGRHGTTAFTIWVEKQSGLIRKSTERRQEELSPSDPSGQYTSEAERVYSIAVLNPSSFPDGTFTFTPPSNAVLVQQFVEHYGGQPIPEIRVRDSAGKEVSLQSFRGKSLLLDLWATWCGPCRDSLPTLEKLYTEYKDKGLVLLSLDQDEDPQRAADFWAKNKVPWPNYHLDKLAGDKFPPHGLPYFVLMDASGKVVFSMNGLDEKDLRAALAFIDSSAKTTAPTAH